MSLTQQFDRARSLGMERGEAPSSRRRAIVDIGSNSVRLVVYDGPVRTPFLLFNEKVTAGLGAALSATGRIDDMAMQRGIDALVRFSGLVRAMEVPSLRCIATAAVRDAANGGEFVARARAEAGMEIEILSGEEEGRASGYGVIGSIPGADGIVADLGGGSLELARVRGGEVERIISLPLGVLRLSAIREKSKGALSKYVASALKKAEWADMGRGLPLYMVGGSWRALAHLDMVLTNFPLPVIHQYHMDTARAATLVRVTAQMGKARLRKIRAISSSRAATLSNASALLAVLVRHLGSSDLIVSAHGLREGLLFQTLSAEERALDPLLVATEAEGEAQGRFPGHGRQIDRWIAPLFRNDPPEWARLRRAACYLADVAWRANPDFRAERGLEIALHSNWSGIDGSGRAMLGQALYSSFGGGIVPTSGFETLVSAEGLNRAVQWGLAIRLAQRLSGGVAAPLGHSRLEFVADANANKGKVSNAGSGKASAAKISSSKKVPIKSGVGPLLLNGTVLLTLDGGQVGMNGEAVARRLRNLAQAMNAKWRINGGDCPSAALTMDGPGHGAGADDDAMGTA